MTVNAFHPDYMKTHEPKFMDAFRTHEARRAAADTLSKHVTEKRKTNPAHGYVHGVSKIPLEMKPFYIYAKAGMPKTRSQIMSDVVAKKRKTNKNYGTVNRDGKNIPEKAPHEKAQ